MALSGVSDARFIAMVRRPVDVAYALYFQFLYNGTEDAASFQEAWDLQDERARGRKVPAGKRKRPRLCQYGEIAMQGEQLARLYTIAPTDRVHVIRYDDFSRDTAAEFATVLNFLGIEPFEPAVYERVNASKVVRFHRIQRLLARIANGPVANRLVELLQSLTGRPLGFQHHVRTMNSKVESRPRLEQSFEKRLVEYFSEDVIQLEQITGWDLAEWRST